MHGHRHDNMWLTIVCIFTGVIFLCSLAGKSYAHPKTSRYFHSGNGSIYIKDAKSDNFFKGIYRNPNGTYSADAIKAINKVFRTDYTNPADRISIRLIEFLDYLEDNLNHGAAITLISGYRSPKYNAMLRHKGGLAAKASLHQYGMAADIMMQGVPPKKIWNFVREIKFGGVGYYHGAYVHVDVGPSRFWDEKTSGVGSGISNGNKLIGIVTDKDIYFKGEKISSKLIRMTEFPLYISPNFILQRMDDKRWKQTSVFNPIFHHAEVQSNGCFKIDSISDGSQITSTLPQKLQTGQYRVVVSFCNPRSGMMPKSATSPLFEVLK